LDEFIILDIETTGLDNKHDSIIEIAAVRLKNFQVVGEFQTLVRPNESALNATSGEITGITAKELETAPDLSEIKSSLLEFVGDSAIIGHNISFDLDFLKSQGIIFPGKGLDTLDLAHTLLPKLKFYSLEYLSHQYNFTNRPSHRALGDVLATAELCQLFVEQFQSFSSELQKQIKTLVDKSRWEWSFIFNQGVISEKVHQILPTKALPPDLANNPLPTAINAKAWATGFSAYELSPNVQQLPVNIALLKQLTQSVLVVSPEMFRSTDWEGLSLRTYYPVAMQLDKDRFEFLISKSVLDESELKLAIKILISLQIEGEFDPAKLHLTRDEFYLFDQKLSLLNAPTSSTLPNQIVTSYDGLEELLANNLPVDTTILLPEWIKFDEWRIEKSAKVISHAYLNAVVSSRRNFVHDYVDDNKFSDQLFKTLNSLGSQLVATTSLLGMVWQEPQEGKQDTLELDVNHFTTQNGALLKDNLKHVISFLEEYQAGIQSLVVSLPEVLHRQLKHNQELIEHLNLLINPNAAYKVFVDGYGGHILVRIIKTPPTNIWQDQLKKFKVAIVGNALLVGGSANFISSILGENVKVETINVPTEQTKEIVWVKDYSTRNKTLDYERQTSSYLKNWVEKEPGKLLILMPNAKMVTNFFNEYQPKMVGTNLLSRDVMGNVDMLSDKLNSLNSYALVIGYYNLERFLPAISNLDRVMFVKLSFDRLSKTAQLLAGDRFDQSFGGYALPKAIIDFRSTLAGLYPKTKEIWVLDQRLQIQDYGKTVMGSISGFHHSDLVIE